MKSQHLIGFLTAMREQQVAVLAQAEAQIVQIDALVAMLSTEDRPRCPECGSEDLADASTHGANRGDRVCKSCTHSFTLEMPQ